MVIKFTGTEPSWHSWLFSLALWLCAAIETLRRLASWDFTTWHFSLRRGYWRWRVTLITFGEGLKRKGRFRKRLNFWVFWYLISWHSHKATCYQGDEGGRKTWYKSMERRLYMIPREWQTRRTRQMLSLHRDKPIPCPHRIHVCMHVNT